MDYCCNIKVTHAGQEHCLYRIVTLPSPIEIGQAIPGLVADLEEPLRCFHLYIDKGLPILHFEDEEYDEGVPVTTINRRFRDWEFEVGKWFKL